MTLLRTIVVAVCSGALSGCGGGSVALTPAAPSSPESVYVFTDLEAPPYGQLTEYGPSGTTPIETFPGGGAVSIALDHNGIIYVASPVAVQEFAPKTHKLLRTIPGFFRITDIRLDFENNLYVVDQGDFEVDRDPIVNEPSSLYEFAPGASKPSRKITTLNPDADDFVSVAIDRTGTVYAGSDNGDIAVILPAAVHPQRTIPATQFAETLALDTLGNLYAYLLVGTSAFSGSVKVFGPGKTEPLRTISAGVSPLFSPRALTLNSTNQLFVANGPLHVANGPSGPSTVTEYAAESTLPVHNYGPFSNPISVAVDPAGNVYVLDTDAFFKAYGLSEFTADRRFIRRLPLAADAFALSTQP